MSSRVASRVPPCVTVMVCVAGCSSAPSGSMPYARNLPPPDFYRQPKAERSMASLGIPVPPQRPAPRPITVDVPMAVLAEVPPPPLPTQVLATAFEPVPDTYLSGLEPAGPAPVIRPYFTPLKTAEAILEPLLTPQKPGAVVLPEPIAYPKYVSVGPEYFGSDSPIAPYVVSRSDNPTAPDRRIAIAQRPVLRPERPAGAYALPEALPPLPRSAPSRRKTPTSPPMPYAPTEVAAALVPPRPDPQQKRVPTDPAPRAPSRRSPDRIGAPALRDETFDLAEDTSAAWIDAANETDAPKPSYPTGLSSPAKPPQPFGDTAPDDTLYRVQISPPQSPVTRVASLGTPAMPPPVDDLSGLSSTLPPAHSILEEPSVLPLLTDTPIPRKKPYRDPAPLRIAGTPSGIVAAPPLPQGRQPANDAVAGSTCLVGRGSGERMILVCNGIDVSQAQVFRAVVEGETAFRGLRAFDPTDRIISTYGFNSDRFLAMSQGPKSARDLAFLRALRASGKSIRVRGRPFDLYLMKGDLNLATVLIERVAGADAPTAVGQR